MENNQSFNKIIEAVEKTGVGFKSFFFRSNLAYGEVFGYKDDDPAIFPLTDMGDYRNGKFNMKFSDGSEYFGSIGFTNKDLHWVSQIVFDEDEKTIPLCGIQNITGHNLIINMYLQFECLKGLDETTGIVFVEVLPPVGKGPEMWKASREWFSK